MEEESSWPDTFWGLIIVTWWDESLRRDSSTPRTPMFRRPGDSLRVLLGQNSSNTLHECQWSGWMQEIEHFSLCPCNSHRYYSILFVIYHVRAWGAFPFRFTSFACHFDVTFPGFTLPSVWILLEVPNGHYPGRVWHDTWELDVVRTAYFFPVPEGSRTKCNRQ